MRHHVITMAVFIMYVIIVLAQILHATIWLNAAIIIVPDMEHALIFHV
jgi:hypothetical protein